MSLTKRSVRILSSILWYLFATVTVLSAAGFGVARLLLPTANQYTAEIEQQIYEIVGQPLKITSLDAEWKGFTPMLVLKDVVVYRKDRSSVVMRFPKIRIGLDIFASLINQSIMVSRFDLIGANLFLTRNSRGEIQITGLQLGDTPTPNKNQGTDHQQLAKWLFGQELLSLELHNLIFTDKFEKQKVYHFSNVTLMIRNENERHIVDATINFSGQQEKELIVSIDSYGDMLDIKNWSGEVYSSGKSLDLVDLIGLDAILDQRVYFSEFNHEIWIDIEKSKITKIQANITTHDFDYESPSTGKIEARQLSYDTLSGEFLWQKKSAGWVFNAREFTVKKPFEFWPRSSFSLEYNKNKNLPIQINADYLKIGYVAEVAALFDKLDDSILSKVVAARTSGVVKDLHVSSNLGDNIVYKGFAKLENVGATIEDELLTFSGLSGKLNLNNQSGSFLVDSNEFMIDVPSVFDYPINVNAIDSDLKWKLDNKFTEVTLEKIRISNSDANLSGRLSLKVPNDDVPASIDLTMNIDRAKGARVYYYLPHKMLSADSNEWLKHAFKTALIDQGSIVVQGPLTTFPYKNGDGKFKIKFHVTDGVLEYADKWPKITSIAADVFFDSTAMQVNFTKASMLASRLKNVSVNIPDLSATTVAVKIRGNVVGDSKDKLKYMLASPPLNEKYGSILTETKLSGYSNLGLEINLKLADETSSQVSGTFDFKNNSLRFKSFGEMLTNASGRINFAANSVEANNIKAKLIGQDAVINISTKSMSEKGQRDDLVLVHAKSSILASELSKRYLPVMQDLWQGESSLDVKINIPLNKHDRNKRSDKGVTVLLDTFLQGISIRLPSPFNKAANQRRHLTTEIVLAENNRLRFRTRYGGYLDSLIEYNNSDSVKEIQGHVRGEVRFGSGVAVLPNSPGVRLVGDLEELKVDIWKSLVDQFEVKTRTTLNKSGVINKQGAISKREDNFQLIHSADVTVKNFSAWGQRAENLSLIVNRIPKGLYAELDSQAVKGHITIPKNLVANPIVMDFEYIHLSGNDEELGGGQVDPRDFPSVLASSKLLTYKEKNFGSVDLAITKLTEGIRIEKLHAQPKATDVLGYGSWLLVNGESVSNFGFHLESTDLGATMIALGYKGSIKGGRGNVNAKFRWPGGLTEFSVDKLAGEVHFSLAEGQLLEYDPLGKASILGLFSIQTLPRRLFLDFSDLVDKGLSFDSITADVNIEDGDAYTTNFKMQGPVVGATLAGRTGLAARDYDQKVNVELRVSDIISFVGLLVASPWAIILPQLLKEEFNSASVLEYTLTGSWDDPKLEPIVEIEQPDEDDIGQE